MTDQPDKHEQPETAGEAAAAVDATPAGDLAAGGPVEATELPREVPHLILTAKPVPEPKTVDVKSADKAAAKQKRLDEASEQSPFSVFVGQVYDGPLDLLLDLIRKQDIDIYDIPIARITAQIGRANV